VQPMSSDHGLEYNASSELAGYAASNAFDRKPDNSYVPDEGSAFCWGASDARPWIAVTFPREACIEGYGISHHAEQFSLADWDLQGSHDSTSWETIDKRRNVMWTGNPWQKFLLLQPRKAHYLFANGLTYGFSNPMDLNEGSESPRLYRFDDFAEEWSIQQIIAGGGAHDVEHFRIGDENFLGVARSMSSAGPLEESEVMRWNGEAFVTDHKLPVGWSTSIEYFEEDSSHFLVVSDHGKNVPFETADVVVLQYRGAEAGWFVVQRIVRPSAASVHDLILFSASGIRHLLAATSPFSELCQGPFSCMQSAIFECDEGNRTQDIRFHSSGYVMAEGGVLARTPSCRWIIAPPRAAQVAINFEYVHSACCFKIVVFACFDATCANRTILSQYSPTADHSSNLDAIGMLNVTSPTGVVAMELERLTQTGPANTPGPDPSGKYFSMSFRSAAVMPIAGGSVELFLWQNTTAGKRFLTVSSMVVADKNGNDQVALDLEHFERDDEHYIVISSVLSSSPFSPYADSLIYQLQAGALVLSQRLEDQPSVRCRHVDKDGLDYLLFASYAGRFRSYRWTGQTFEVSSSSDASMSNLETFALESATFVVALDSPGKDVDAYWNAPSPQPTWISLLRWHDALKLHGTIDFSDAFTPTASFVIRRLRETTLLASHNRTFEVTLRPDRDLPPGVTVRIIWVAGTRQSAGDIALFGPDSMTFGGIGTWSQVTRDLVLKSFKAIDSKSSVSFSFSLEKDFEPRTALNAQVACEGQIIILPQTMENVGKHWPAQTGRLRQDCNVGYSAADAFPCEACAPGFYKVMCA